MALVPMTVLWIYITWLIVLFGLQLTFTTQHLKTLDATDYRQYEGRFWRPHYSLLVNHVTGKSTVLQWSKIAYGAGALADDYHPDNLAAVSGRYSRRP